MGIEVVCGGCGCPIGLNQQTSGAQGYCMKCTVRMQLEAQINSILNSPIAPIVGEKEVAGERGYGDQKLIGEE